MISYAPDDPFVAGILDAWAQLAQGLGIPRVQDWHEPEPPTYDDSAPVIDACTKLGPGVTWHTGHELIYPYCYAPRFAGEKARKLTFGKHYRPTPKNAALCARIAAAARACRDSGGDEVDIRRAAQEAGQ